MKDEIGLLRRTEEELTTPASDYERLIRPIEDRMIRSVWRVVRDPDDAEDAFQEALQKVWSRFKRIKRHPNPHALILRVCINAAYDVLRRKARQRRAEEMRSVPASVPDLSPSALSRLVSREKQTRVLNAIGKLPRNQATAVLMRFVDNLSYGDIAQALGCGETTARVHVTRARAKLRKLLPDLVRDQVKGVVT